MILYSRPSGRCHLQTRSQLQYLKGWGEDICKEGCVPSCLKIVCLTLGGIFTAGAISRDILSGEKRSVSRGSKTSAFKYLWLLLVLHPFRYYRGTRSILGSCKGTCLHPHERWVQAPVSGWLLDGRRSSPWTHLPCWLLLGLAVISMLNNLALSHANL